MNNYNYLNYNRYVGNDLYRATQPINNGVNSNYNMNSNNYNTNLYSPEEGYLNGNMFSNLYSEYKNYKPMKITPRNEQEKALYDLASIAFASHELNLYLDLNPNDSSMLTLYRDYNDRYKQLVSAYEQKYGPLSATGGDNTRRFNWINNWPWEDENV